MYQQFFNILFLSVGYTMLDAVNAKIEATIDTFSFYISTSITYFIFSNNNKYLLNILQ